ncbi:EF-hand domain-containing protein [Shimia sp. CNT1-13L.2]|jgi:Ca2+-binding EF-hand superfamily protein|uniref:EF-hand domain-containing protein n=1 Tax=Shimia sp. CNT1-13L.2 TaxID=2959663 RepID=UPI0020CFCC27|nr:EF-hand domain-containing protein [Shimia sp. CNT1-13L.2]MCP9481709.1 EF-hand domain-containing protein [Shimia sp. CNT1-13L.2]
MKRAMIISGVLAAAMGLTAVSASAKGWGPGGHHGPRPMMNFEAFDADKDGKVTKAEMEAFAKAKFTEADTDGDGLLSQEEMQAKALEEAQKRMKERSAKMIERKDADKDGKLSFEEMSANEKRKDKMFNRLDRDGDGAISKEEFEEARAHMEERGHKMKKRHKQQDN